MVYRKSLACHRACTRVERAAASYVHESGHYLGREDNLEIVIGVDEISEGHIDLEADQICVDDHSLNGGNDQVQEYVGQ